MEDAEKSKASESQGAAFVQTLNKCTLLMFAFVFCRGLNMGVIQTFRDVYLSEELEATPEIIGSQSTVALGAGILAAAFAKPIMRTMGTFNIIYLGILLEGVKSIALSLIK